MTNESDDEQHTQGTHSQLFILYLRIVEVIFVFFLLAQPFMRFTGGLESPLQLIILLWLMMKGILTFPWNESPTYSCVDDSLGRIACFPSLPVAFMILSILSIVKSLHDLNINPMIEY